MRVLHLFKSYYPPTRGGVEQWINDIAHSMDGIESVVLTASRDRRLHVDDDEGVRVVRAPTIVRASTAPIVPSWPGWIRRLRPDVVHAHMPNPTGELAVMLARSGAPVVAHYHADVVRAGGAVPAMYDRLAARFLARAHGVAVGSPRLAETTPVLQRVRDRVTVIPYGVDVRAWCERPAQADEIAARHPGPLLLFVGRLRPYKGILVLIDAMASIDATLLVVGGGPLRAEAEKRAAVRGVAGRVRFVGDIPDEERSAYYHAADVFVLPSISRGESYGIVQVEAMATGTPSVCTEIGTGTSWVNRHGETGLVAPSRDPVALAGAINELLGDGARRAAMGRAAQQRVRDHLSRDVMLAALRDLYEDAAQATPA